MELCNTTINYNDLNNTPLSNMNIQEAILQVMKEEEEEAITDATNATADTFSLVFIPLRGNLNAVFTSEKLENTNELVNAVANMKINDVGYELNAATASDAHVEFLINPDRNTHTNNEITQQNLLSSWMIGIRHKNVHVLPPPTDLRIGANNQPEFSISTGIVLVPQALK